ncbi:MAG: TonB-dependent receptor [Polyangiaceae bacterium]|nr:TonB-dependent receptor [Polyangiaceae bacterium]
MSRLGRIRRVVSVGGVALACGLAVAALAAPPARADDLADEADLAFRVGAERYQAGDFRGALEQFLRSNRLVPNRNVVFNIARCYEQLRDYPSAWRYYALALDAEKGADARRRIEEALARIGPNVAVLSIESDPPGATVYLDRRDLGPRGETPRRLGLAPGKYRVLLERPGFEPVESGALEIVAGSNTPVKLPMRQIVGRVRLAETARGATVRVGDDSAPPVGVAPLVLSLPPGRQRLFLHKPGAHPVELEVDVVARRETVVRPRFQTLTGELVVASDLRGAAISVDGRVLGFTPAVLAVPVGEHELTLSLPGYQPVTRRVRVAARKGTRVTLELARREQVTAASRADEAAEDAPASVTILPARELRAFGYPTLAEALRGTRGIHISDDRSYTTLGFRGYSYPGDYGNKVLVLQDGHPLNENILGQSFPAFDGRVDLEDVQRVEVIRGPGSALYGTGAFLGVVNLVTHGRDGRTRGEVGLGTSEYGVGRGRALGYARLGDDSGVWTSVAAAKASGRDFVFEDYRGDPSGLDGEARGLDGFDAATVQGRWWWRSVSLQWFWHHRDKQLPTGEYEALFGDPRARFVDRRGFVELRWEPEVGEHVDLLTRAHANVASFEGVNPYDVADGGPTVEHYDGRWIGLEQRFVWKPADAIRFTLGGEGQRHLRARMAGRDDAGPYLDGADDHAFTALGLYGVGDVVATDWLKLSAGARFDVFRWSSAVAGITPEHSALSPRVALVIRPYERGTTKLIVGQAFRAPSAYQIYYSLPGDQDPNPDLEPERVTSGELEHTHRFSSTVTGTTAGWANYVSGPIVFEGEAPRRYVSSDTPILSMGGELELRRDWRDGWMLAGSYGVQRTRFVGGEGLREVPNWPMHLASVRGSVPLLEPAFVLSARVSAESSRFDRNDTDLAPDGVTPNPPQGKTEGAVVADLVFSGEASGERLRWSFGVYNLFDWRYSAPPSTEFRMTRLVQPGRTLLASATVSF